MVNEMTFHNPVVSFFSAEIMVTGLYACKFSLEGLRAARACESRLLDDARSIWLEF